MFRTNHTNSLCHGKKQCCITNQQLFELDGLKNNLMTKEYVEQHCSKGHGLNSKDLVVRWRLVTCLFANLLVCVIFPHFPSSRLGQKVYDASVN